MVKLNKGLGRGLDALLAGSKDQGNDALKELKVDQIVPGKYQPRSRMDEESLAELAASIKAQGIMQPILVRELVNGGYEIIAGERRWRAAQLAGLTQVTVLVRKVPDNAALAMALIENIQREDLNPLEEAVGIQRLIDEFQMTHQTAADAVGRSRSAASNLLRLLKLPELVQGMLMDGKLDMGHARALLPLDAAQLISAANKIIADNLTVRDAEKLVQAMLNPKAKSGKAEVSRDILNLQEELSQAVGTAVQIKVGKQGKGKLIIEYTSNDHLEEIIARLK
ncbi:MAG: ParB/RepB/Spo0J family partition protein [Gallionellaceae bacterium]|nr:ParB/RepB/Spo0J family partition protein [Gallionellaceae bacterium]